LIEIQGSLKLWQSQQRLVKQAVQLCQQLGHECSTRLANTPQAAIALARSSATRVQDVPLHRIGLSHHGIKERILEQLANMGIYRLGQLMKLPKASLSKRFGQNLISYLKRLEGTLVEPRHCIQPSNHFTQQLHLLKPIMNKTVLLQGPMPYLTQQLQSWLIARQISCVSLEWQFSPFRGAGRNVAVTFAGGKQRQDDFMRLSHLRLDNIKLPEEVLSIRLEVKVVAPLQAINNDLFGSTESAAGLVSGLVDELTARLGPNTCKTIRPIEQYTPEKAWQRYSSQPRIISANNQSKAKNTVKATSGLTAYPQLMGKRPLWLFPHPREIAITDLELIQGPERIQSNFQLEAQQKTISRDYYIAKHKQGAICWAFTESSDNKIKAHKSCWYLHGYFA
jgi:protein ImuB